jgi:hypothetical protein
VRRERDRIDPSLLDDDARRGTGFEVGVFQYVREPLLITRTRHIAT